MYLRQPIHLYRNLYICIQVVRKGMRNLNRKAILARYFLIYVCGMLLIECDPPQSTDIYIESKITKL